MCFAIVMDYSRFCKAGLAWGRSVLSVRLTHIVTLSVWGSLIFILRLWIKFTHSYAMGLRLTHINIMSEARSQLHCRCKAHLQLCYGCEAHSYSSYQVACMCVILHGSYSCLWYLLNGLHMTWGYFQLPEVAVKYNIILLALCYWGYKKLCTQKCA